MTTPDSNMPISRQLRYERECRDKWKDNALKKQAKIREQVQAIRALKKSRDSWKAKAQLLKQRVLDLENQLQQQSDSSNSNSSDSPDSSRERVTFASGVLVSGRCPTTKSVPYLSLVASSTKSDRANSTV